MREWALNLLNFPVSSIVCGWGCMQGGGVQVQTCRSVHKLSHYSVISGHGDESKVPCWEEQRKAK